MTAQAGRTHVKHIQVFLDNSGGTLTEITSITGVGSVGLTHDAVDVTSWSDGSKNVVIGQPGAPIVLTGVFDTVTHAHLTAINGLSTPLTLDIRVGIRHAWEAGEPQFGITSSATSGYLLSGYTTDFSTWTANLDVFGSTAPAFGTAAET